VTESAANATCGSNGNCTYTFTHAIPAAATGTYTIGGEARMNVMVPELLGAQPFEAAAQNPVVNFSLDGSAVVPRRTVVQLSNCNNCHVALSLHGNLRNPVTDPQGYINPVQPISSAERTIAEISRAPNWIWDNNFEAAVAQGVLVSDRLMAEVSARSGQTTTDRGLTPSLRNRLNAGGVNGWAASHGKVILLRRIPARMDHRLQGGLRYTTREMLLTSDRLTLPPGRRTTYRCLQALAQWRSLVALCSS
jgi:hypothetical protein